LTESGVSTSTYGLGASFNEELLSAMADAGGGQAYYGETAEDLLDPFREEFDLLSAMCGCKLRLRLDPSRGVSVRVLNDYRADAEGRSILPDLAYGSVAWALLKVRVPASLAAESPGGTLHILSACVEYEDGEGRSRQTEPAHLRLTPLPAAAYADVAQDDTVVARAREIRAAELLQEARTAAQRHDWEAVDSLLASARAEAGENEWVAATISALQEYASLRDQARFSKEAYFASRKKRMRLAEPNESSAYLPDREALKPGYARRKPRQGKDFSGESGS
jgi:Ca-activated chloride channel family protein